ncbi:PTS system mannose/fructose/sorbose family transporter subunit IID [Virgibacillus salexigens]|uniref:PTS system mannose-specific EIID component n=2 Tax=Virgibacillus TaxID=84406 RepID=A0A024Q947_9BACI|nr:MULTISPECIES: PTS system mannose/fructose/sorbose family transporter subunit IID [Virgibacillus]MYL40759.1 PTS N-acetylgalactosamine transporter subunit IID [Virgibacillus massiliensis]GGJ51549.1 PTS N-acetylgalactosamine transporter subunit IID [Virgibacillus kapii]CDQ38446.1 PTS system mannose-specific EIID component [Virgibacillus massiliensis]
MASNHYQYEDTTSAQDLPPKQIRSLAWRSLLLQASFNYERMQAAGWLYSILPGLRVIHKNKKDLSKSMKDHLEFFNTHPFLVTFIMGIILAMEQKKEDREAIRGIKVATMGPLGGIGDALFYLTLLPITASIGASLAVEGNILGPFIFLIMFNIIHFGVRFGLMRYGYRTGVKAIGKLKEGTKHVSRAASIVGLTVVGGLIATYVTFKIDYTWKQGESELNVQTDILDQIMPAMLPLIYTLLIYWLLKKGRSPILLIGITVIVGLIGSYFGIM